ncbi:MAG: alpha-ribazole phosphatase [Bacillota bacterium]
MKGERALARIFLVRHGETLWNRSFLYQGQRDIPLSERGREQAKRVAKALESQKFSAIYSSDLKRACETACEIAKFHNIDVACVKDLREINFGKWEGHSYVELQEKYPAEFSKWLNDPFETRPPEGENLRELIQRVVDFLKKVVIEHQSEDVLVVTHAGPIRAVLMSILELGAEHYWKFKISNASITVVNWDDSGDVGGDGSFIIKVNETAHLE